MLQRLPLPNKDKCLLSSICVILLERFNDEEMGFHENFEQIFSTNYTCMR